MSQPPSSRTRDQFDDLDLLVIGLGSVGSFALRHAARIGLSVLGVEQFGLEHDRGAYAGESRLYRTLYHEGADYLPLLQDAREEWLDLQKAGRRRLFLETGVLSIAADDAPQLRGVKDTAESYDLPNRRLSAEELHREFPQHHKLGQDVGILDQLGGVIRSEAGVAEAQRQAVAAGAAVLTDTPVHSLRHTPGGVEAQVGDRTVRASAAVIAAGSWTPKLVPQLTPALSARKITLTWFAPSDPANFTPEVCPAFIRDFQSEEGTTHLFGVPTLDGTLVKVGVGDVWNDPPEERAPDDLPRHLPEDALREIGETVHSLIPDLPSRPSRHSVHMDLFTPDRRALLGLISDNVAVAAGLSGHGFKLAPTFGKLAVESATGSGPSLDISSFDPLRFSS
ncbi:N-methyl-L-tryptophan oxidase [Nesterenkonia sp. MY13]|uniref:N-methyl-L-tryptophan oxidase n=1 Tax=Nesterenkonia sedimenti TaxID=1463632 RepID=A0A7X8TJH0_9MICC|nr:N-methyl-L-tryptophan oxidase [Nesterenkonia sedimenti]NLS09719.1 N-methyl-L-tryptophan oxidase [Nesterenkonia sedimenti]